MTAPASRNRTGALLVGATVACLVPFLNKAFHIDDPLFLWVAERIPQHPLAPYDFNVVWYQTATRVAGTGR